MDFICLKTRECRANNFLGMSYGPPYEGINTLVHVTNPKTGEFIRGVDDLLGDKLVIFEKFQNGMNAALWRLKAVYFDKGINTASAIYAKWSGDQSKGLVLAEMMGVKAKQVLEFNFNDLKDLIHAMLRFEDSTKVFESDLINIPDAMYLEAIAYAVHKTQAVTEIESAVPESVKVGNKNLEVGMKFKIFNHVLDLKALGDDLVMIAFALAGLLGINVENYTTIFTQLGAQVASDLAHIHQIGYGALIVAAFKLYNNNTLSLEKVNLTPHQASSPIAKVGLFLLGFLLLSSVANAQQTIWTYSGGLNFSKQSITQPTNGFFSFPLIGGTASPIEFKDNETYIEPQFGLSLVYLFSDGTLSPNGNGLGFTTNGVALGFDAGDGAFTTAPDGGTYVSSGVIGPAIFIPSAFGNLGFAINQQFGQPWNLTPTLLFVQSFDIGGLGVFKW